MTRTTLSANSSVNRSLPTGRLKRRRTSLLYTLLTVLAVLGMYVASSSHALAQEIPSMATAGSAVDWLLEQRLADGAYPGLTGEGDPGVTVDAVLALSAAGEFDEIEPSLAYLEEHALVFAQIGPGSAAKLAVALDAAGLDPHNFAFVDPLSIVEHAATNGMIGFGPFDHAIGLIALAAGGSDIPDMAIAAVFESQAEDGGWAFDGSTAVGSSDTNTTALMIQAAYAAGLGDDERLDSAISWLLAVQDENGGMPYQSDGPVDSNSTAIAIQALIASGAAADDPALAAMQEALGAFQNENGSMSWLLDPRDDNIFSTVQAIPALVGTALPVESPASTMLEAA